MSLQLAYNSIDIDLVSGVQKVDISTVIYGPLGAGAKRRRGMRTGRLTWVTPSRAATAGQPILQFNYNFLPTSTLWDALYPFHWVQPVL